MKKILSSLAIIIGLTLPAAAQNASGNKAHTADLVEGSAKVGTYEVNVGDFENLNVVDGIEVELHCLPDSAGRVYFETSREVASGLIFTNNQKGKLTIEKQFHEEGQLVYNLPTIHVFTRFLTEVTNAGDSTVRVNNPKPCPKFKATLIGNGKLIVRDLDCNKVEGSIQTGNGTLVLSGTSKEVTLSNTGVGTILADDLQTTKATCKFFGKGTTGVWATDEITVKGMFPGKLYYKGNPQKIKNYGMGVKVIRMTDGLPVADTEITDR